jgi:uncharacterized protein DUF3606
MKTQDADFIHPEDVSNLNYWTKKWGVSMRQLNDAILYTGSLSTTRIKDYLKKDTWYYSPVPGLWKMIKNKIKIIH